MKKYLVIILYIGAIGGMVHDESSSFECYNSMKSDDDSELFEYEGEPLSFADCLPGQQQLLSDLVSSQEFTNKKKLIARTLIENVPLASRSLMVESKLKPDALSITGQKILVKISSDGALPERGELLILDRIEKNNETFFNYKEKVVIDADQGAVRSFVNPQGGAAQFRCGLALDPFNLDRYVPANSDRWEVVVADKTTGQRSVAFNNFQVLKIYFHKYVKNVLVCCERLGRINVWKVPDRLGSDPCKFLNVCYEGVNFLQQGSASSVDFNSQNHALLATGTTKGFIFLWNMFSGHKIKEWMGHKKNSEITKVSFLPCDERYLLSAGEDATIRMWDINDASCVRSIDGHQDKIGSARIIENLLITASEDKTVRQWDFENIQKALNWFSHIQTMQTEFEVRSPDLGHEGEYKVRKERVNYVIVYLILEQIAQAISTQRKARLEPYEIAYISAVFPDWMQQVFRKYIAVKKRNVARDSLLKKLKNSLSRS